MKRIIHIAAVCASLCAFALTAQGTTPIYTNDVTETMVRGVTHRRIEQFYSDYSLTIHAVTADLSEEHLALELLKDPESVDRLSTVAELAKTQDGVVAATNADFFSNYNAANRQGFAIGAEVKDGALLETQIDGDTYASAMVSGDRVWMGHFRLSLAITAPGGESIPIAHSNTWTDYHGDILMYTADFNGGYSPAYGGETVEMVVVDGIVTEFRRQMEPVLIPENGYVLTVSEGVNMFLANNFQLGDHVALQMTADPTLDGVDTVVGGGTMLVEDGQKAVFTHTVSGRNPRTAIGVDESGTRVTLVTVDGRQTASRGMTQDELADLMLSLGCYRALNFDGGGSTALVGKTLWDSELHTINSPTENRRVINGVAIVSSAEVGAPSGIQLQAESDTVLLEDSVALRTRIHDAYQNAILEEDAALLWTIDGVSGSVADDRFYPSSAGTATLRASLPSALSEEVTITVMDQVSGITAPRRITAEVGETVSLPVSVFDQKGHTADVENLALLLPTTSSKILQIESGVITAVGEGYAIVRLQYGAAESYTLVTVGAPSSAPPAIPPNVYDDDAQGHIVGGASFAVASLDGDFGTPLARLIYAQTMARLHESDSYALVGGTRRADLTPTIAPIMANSYSALERSAGLVISLVGQNGLRSGSQTQWDDLNNAIAASPSSTVIFLLKAMPTFTDPMEEAAFYDYMKRLAAYKQVFIITGGADNLLQIRDGVRYFTLCNKSAYPSAMDAIGVLRYLSITSGGGESAYSWNNVY